VARCWIMERQVLVDAGGVPLPGFLVVPAGAKAIVVFAHGSGSSRLSPRNRRVAEALQDAGLATLLFDLLTPDEERQRTNVFDIDLLADRMEDATHWLRGEVPAELPVSYFGASTGGAAALVAASRGGSGVASVVSRGGRPDLAGRALEHVLSPTLLIVGQRDPEVLVLNQAALARLRCERHLEIVPGATHLFEEPGAIETVARLAIDWFERHR
jgi:putative phosphoribosyl transferase